MELTEKLNELKHQFPHVIKGYETPDFSERQTYDTLKVRMMPLGSSVFYSVMKLGLLDYLYLPAIFLIPRKYEDIKNFGELLEKDSEHPMWYQTYLQNKLRRSQISKIIQISETYLSENSATEEIMKSMKKLKDLFEPRSKKCVEDWKNQKCIIAEDFYKYEELSDKDKNKVAKLATSCAVKVLWLYILNEEKARRKRFWLTYGLRALNA